MKDATRDSALADEWDAAPAKSMKGTAPRAKERVMMYLRDQFERLELPVGARLPTSRTLAAQLDVSVSTVQTVFRQLAAEGTIRTVVGNGSFLVRPTQPAARKSMRIGVTFGFKDGAEETEPWHLAICGSVLSAASALSTPASIVPIQMPSAFAPAAEILRFLESFRDKVDGIILRPLVAWPEVRGKLPAKHFPDVHLNPVEFAATTNFVSSDYFHAGAAVSRAFLASGRKFVYFLHTVPERLGVSSSLRVSGLVTQLGNKITTGVRLEMGCAEAHTRAAGKAAARRIFEGPKPRPDAICALSSELAEGVIEYCKGARIDIPGELSVVSASSPVPGTGGRSGLTCECQDTNRIGVELLKMLLWRIENDGRDAPGILLPVTYGGGATTLAEENQVLGIE